MPILKLVFVRSVILSLVMCVFSARAGVVVAGLQCEYLTDPLGIDVTIPRFNWKIVDPQHTRGQKQTGYQVLVAGSRDLLNAGQGDIWDSGRVASSQSALVPFAGKDLTSDEECFWKVRFFDKDEQPSAWSAAARFTMGLLKAEDWSGPWIKHPTAPEEKHIWFRQHLSLEATPTAALIQVASVGYHELYVNGKKADARVLAPSLTRLDKRVLYVTYDVAAALHRGDNCIAVWTGAGWSRYSFFKTESALRVQLAGKTVVGGKFSLASDTSWRCAPSSSEDIGGCKYGDHGGEEIDARKYHSNWNRVDFDDTQWDHATVADITATLSAQMIAPSRVIETIPARSVSGTGPFLVDLDKNYSGWLSIKMRNQAAGDVVKIQISDNPIISQSFGQKNVYICRGGGSETFQNRFNYAAGRYITITGLKAKPRLGDITGQAIGTDLNRVGSFSCSSQLFNRIYETDLWTYRANTVEGYTEDCPHRERLGYGEENFATAWGCGLPNYDAGAFYTMVIRNWCDVQQPNGWINQTAPQINLHYGGAMWSSAPLNIGWEFYKTYGDKRILIESYATDRAWLDFLASNVVDGLLRPYRTNYNGGGNFLGDWLSPYQPGDPPKGMEFGTTTAALLFNNCVYAMNLYTFVEIARTLGKPGDAAVYDGRLQALKAKVQAHFFNPANNTYLDTRQIHLAFPMLAGITPDEVKPGVYANFEKEILERRPYLDMGSSGLPVLLKYLVEEVDRNDILCANLAKTNEPSYGYFLKCGETAWPEAWNDHGASRIHTCFTGIAAWFMKGLGGIREDPNDYGYQSFIIKPALVGNLFFASARTQSLYGTISDHWEKRGGSVQMDVEIPVNTSATVYVPAADVRSVTESDRDISRAPGATYLKTEAGCAVFRVQSGIYHFVSKPNGQ